MRVCGMRSQSLRCSHTHSMGVGEESDQRAMCIKGLFYPSMWLKIKIVFHQFLFIRLLDQ